MIGRRVSSATVVWIVVMSSFIGLFILPRGPVDRAEALTWTQTTQSDFESALSKWNVNTEDNPGNVTLISDPSSWIKRGTTPVFENGSSGSWDSADVNHPSVLLDGGGYKMWYEGDDNTFDRIGFATSPDGIVWTRELAPVLTPGPAAWENSSVITPFVIKERGIYEMWYGGVQSGGIWQIGHANSSDGISWSKYVSNPVLAVGAPGAWDSAGVHSPTIIWDASVSLYKMWYTGFDGTYERIGYAESNDGLDWSGRLPYPVLDIGSFGAWDYMRVRAPTVIKEGAEYSMWYSGFDGSRYRIGYATSSDGTNWTKHPNNPIMESGPTPLWDSLEIDGSSVLKVGQAYVMWYNGFDGSHARIGMATAAYGSKFVKESSNPVLDLGPAGSWDAHSIFGPSIIYKDGIYHMWYSGSDGTRGDLGTWRIGYATSIDGIVWEKHRSNPVLDVNTFPWDSGAVVDQTVIWNGTGYEMWYQAWDNTWSRGGWRFGHAASSDGIVWTKSPDPVLEYGSGFESWNIESPTVLLENGLYKMWYAGVNDSLERDIGYAESLNGLNWTRHPSNPVVRRTEPWEGSYVHRPTVLNVSGAYYMVYLGASTALGIAFSSDGVAWTKTLYNPILSPNPGSWDGNHMAQGLLLKEGTGFRMWYDGWDTMSVGRIGHAVSADAVNWTKRAVNPVLSQGGAGEWDHYMVSSPSVIREGQIYSMWFDGVEAYGPWSRKIGHARSTDGVSWVKTDVPVLLANSSNSWEAGGVQFPYVLKIGNSYKMWYGAFSTPSGTDDKIGYAESYDGINWTRPVTHPVLDAGGPGEWDSLGLWGQSVICENGVYRMWYGGAASAWQGRIGYAESLDGISWVKHPGNPVLGPGGAGSWDELGVGGPYVIKAYGFYLMAYNGVNQPGPGQMGIAISVDGINWTKSRLNPILNMGPSGRWDRGGIFEPSLLLESDLIKMWYTGEEAGPWIDSIGLASSEYWGMGILESSVFDSGHAATIWRSMSWDATLPLNTKISFTAHGGDTPTPDGTWSEWMNDTTVSGSLLSIPRSRYIQYRATLVSMNALDTPILREVDIDYDLEDVSPPQPTSPPMDVCINDPTPAFMWNYFDPEGDAQSALHLQVDNGSAFNFPAIDANVTSSVHQYTPQTPLTDDAWNWRVKTADFYSVWSAWSTTMSFSLDTTPPVTTPSIGHPSFMAGATTYITPSTPVSLAASDTGCGSTSLLTRFRLFVGGYWTSWANFTEPLTMPRMDGEVYLEHYSTDAAGNIEPLNNLTLTVDIMPPVTSLSVGSPNSTSDGNYYISDSTPMTLNAIDYGSGVNVTYYRIDPSGTWTEYTGQFSLSGRSGLHNVQFYSIDNLGNLEVVRSLGVYIEKSQPPSSGVQDFWWLFLALFLLTLMLLLFLLMTKRKKEESEPHGEKVVNLSPETDEAGQSADGMDEPGEQSHGFP